MKCGDISLSEIESIKEISKDHKSYCRNNNVNLLYNSFENLLKNCSLNEMQKVALDMLNHFMTGNGKEYRNELLTKHAKNHNSTLKYVKNTKEMVKNYILQKKGNINNIKLDLGTDKYFGDLTRPRFNSWLFDTFAGLRITVNDTWGMRIELKNFVYCKKHNVFEGDLDFIIYDHFGLDGNDVEKFGNIHRGFGAWYCLQRYSGFNKKYKPFIDYIEFTEHIEGGILPSYT